MRLAMQSVIRSGYAALGCLAILLLTGTSFSFASLYSLLGVALIILASPAAIFIFAFLGAYVPDSQFIVSNVMRIGMFLTPIFWSYDGSGGIQHAFYWWNPFTYFLDIVREPIIAQVFPARSFVFCVFFSVLSWALALWVLGRYRKEVVFVL